jgi:hypothetical protein
VRFGVRGSGFASDLEPLTYYFKEKYFMEIPKGQFVLYQPKYRTPSIFDLHEGLLHYRYIAEGHKVEGNISYSYIVHKGTVSLRDDIWDCWIGYAGSEIKGDRVCQTMEAVFAPLAAIL